MNRRTRLQIFILAAIVSFVVVPHLLAQDQQQSRQQSQQQTNPPQQTQKPSLQNPQQNATAPPPVDPKEEAAFKAFNDIKPSSPADYDAQIQAGEAFVKDFPQSRYREAVYSSLANAYFQKGELDKTCDAADRALALNPDDLIILTHVGWMIPHGNPNAPNFDEQLAKAEQYEKHALQVLNTLPKPANLTDEQFNTSKNAALSESHSGLGLIYFRQKKYDVSSAELQQATAMETTPDPTDLFVLGFDDETLQKYPDSVKAFDGCAQIASPLQDRCKQASAEAKAKEGAAPPQKP
ncbi:MAG: tetratricopeptide repeat protein [Candidatus Acidiferrales bacterium]